MEYPPFPIGNISLNGPFSIAMLVYRSVHGRKLKDLEKRPACSQASRSSCASFCTESFCHTSFEKNRNRKETANDSHPTTWIGVSWIYHPRISTIQACFPFVSTAPEQLFTGPKNPKVDVSWRTKSRVLLCCMLNIDNKKSLLVNCLGKLQSTY